MDNLEAAILIVRLYGNYTKHVGSNENFEQAVALAVGALRKDSERKNESN